MIRNGTEYHAEWRRKNPERAKAIQVKYNRSNLGRFRSLLASAKLRDLPVEIDYGTFIDLLKYVCYYCHGPLAKTGAGLDRIDSSKGYTEANVVPCCLTCNIAKGSMSRKEFFRWIDRVHKAIHE